MTLSGLPLPVAVSETGINEVAGTAAGDSCPTAVRNVVVIIGACSTGAAGDDGEAAKSTTALKGDPVDVVTALN